MMMNKESNKILSLQVKRSNLGLCAGIATSPPRRGTRNDYQGVLSLRAKRSNLTRSVMTKNVRSPRPTGLAMTVLLAAFSLAILFSPFNFPAWAAEKSPVPVSIRSPSRIEKPAKSYPSMSQNFPGVSSSDSSDSIDAFLAPGRKIAELAPSFTTAKNVDSEILKQEAQSAWLEAVKVENNRFTLTEGRSHFMRFSTRIARISVSNPAVLDFLTLSSSEILLNAKLHGSVNLMVWDMKGDMSSFDINVIRDPGLLDQLLHEIDPKGEFEIFPSRDVFVVRGFTSSVQKKKYVEDAVKSFAPGSVSLVRVKHIKQILLQIRFVQIDHSRDYDFGLDLQRLAQGTKHISSQTFAPGKTNASPAAGSTRTLTSVKGSPSREFAGLMSENVADAAQDVYQLIYENDNNLYRAFLKAKEADGVAKIIARPNLLAMDGEEASFVVGGESAIVISTNNQLTVQYKEFGTSLKYKPEIMEDGEISLTLEPEVSQTNTVNGVEIDGFTIPGFSKTKVKTVVQLKDGETLVIGGMIQQIQTTSDTGVPFLRRIPVIGKAFQSTSRGWQETELLIIVTPKIIQPEKTPIIDGAQNDVLDKATGYLEPAVPADVQATAIKYYLDKNQRWGEIDKLAGELKDLDFSKKGTLSKKETSKA